MEIQVKTKKRKDYFFILRDRISFWLSKTIFWRVNPKWKILEVVGKTPWVLQLIGYGKHVVILNLGIDKFDDFGAIDDGDVEKSESPGYRV